MPEECESEACRRVVCEVASVELRGELDSAVALPGSDGSSGICTVRRGRAAPIFRLLERDGGVKVVSGIEETDTLRTLSWVRVLERWGMGGEVVLPLRDMVATSTDCERFDSDFIF
jgi:hypothetical protein